MQLSNIKIVGFKSFVDPTTIHLPSKLVAIVGPNGCGKSNIIDAVTWVMGESSPKYLRGESLTDVIFNGSTARKPIGQASVELVFDNSDGTIGGEYAKYNEISVKRVINRDSDSTYYLNGARCRKRDVVDIFLGTGLGPRSYSIIGQNMISRVIEAKPDDLRTYLEEAAGISKYKERKHETELRIKHTHDNLARVNDIRAELEKQLSHLKHQANVAEKFKTLKEQERILRAELLSIQWRQLDGQMVDYTLNVQREETALEARNTELSGTNRDIEQLRHEQRVAHDAFQEVQRRYYAVGNEITRIEQDILHHQERQQQWENDLNQTIKDWQLIKDQMTESEDNARELEHEITSVEPQLLTHQQEAKTLQTEMQSADEKLQTLQNNWDAFHQTSAKTTQAANVEKNSIQHLEQQITFLQKRQDQLQQDKDRVNFSELNNEINEFDSLLAEVNQKVETASQNLNEVRQTISALHTEQREANTELDRLRSELQRLRGSQASLEALQQTALGQRNNAVTPWLNKHNLQTKPRLAQSIEVENGWELAVEKVLGEALQAICVENGKEVTSLIKDFKSGNLCVFTCNESTKATEKKHDETLLLDKIKCPYSLESLIAGVYIADSLNEAMALCESLKAHESVVTRDGTWLNRSWLKVLREENAAEGVFQREQEMKKIATTIKELQTKQKELEEGIEERRGRIQQVEQQRDQLQQTYSQYQAQAAQFVTQHKMKKERLTELQKQSERYTKEYAECLQQLDKAQNDLIKTRERWQQAMSDLETQAQTRDELLSSRDTARQNLQSLRTKVNEKKERIHEFEIRLQSAKSQKSASQQNIQRMQTQLASLNERKITLQSELSSMPPIDTLKKSLTRALDKHVSVEVELNTARSSVELLDQEFRNLEDKRQIIERDINKLRTSLEGLRLELQGWKVKAENLLEQIKETGYVLEEILKQLASNVTAEEWQAKLDQVVQRINRLGPINLVAIEEYSTCLERKEYLDKQIEDLQSGLTTLEEAIAKIDKDTRTKFKETFDKVNQQFQELFPTIFGGGKAYLELTEENLLEAGVTVMACPPGKRNSSIYLLSGGEKTLTALALIFSIFHLNPAPFCLLDEVDAALDDANVLRFTRLVKSMSNNTQFIFISHNKISIEMGEHLIGVTMNEPGVSRLVSVDIEKAMSLAGS